MSNHRPSCQGHCHEEEAQWKVSRDQRDGGDASLSAPSWSGSSRSARAELPAQKVRYRTSGSRASPRGRARRPRHRHPRHPPRSCVRRCSFRFSLRSRRLRPSPFPCSRRRLRLSPFPCSLHRLLSRARRRRRCPMRRAPRQLRRSSSADLAESRCEQRRTHPPSFEVGRRTARPLEWTAQCLVHWLRLVPLGTKKHRCGYERAATHTSRCCISRSPDTPHCPIVSPVDPLSH